MADPTLRFGLDLGALSAQVQPILQQRGRSLTRRIANEARARVPVATGYLGRSIREDPVVQVGPFRVDTGVTAASPYAGFVHEGTRPHVIRPRNASVLAFPGAGGGTIFASEVHHPGTRPRPFLREAGEYVVGQES